MCFTLNVTVSDFTIPVLLASKNEIRLSPTDRLVVAKIGLIPSSLGYEKVDGSLAVGAAVLHDTLDTNRNIDIIRHNISV